jgi:hypothetical protein
LAWSWPGWAAARTTRRGLDKSEVGRILDECDRRRRDSRGNYDRLSLE